MSSLAGYRTYIIAGLVLVVTLLYVFGVVDEKTLLTIQSALLGTGLATLRQGVASQSKAADALAFVTVLMQAAQAAGAADTLPTIKGFSGGVTAEGAEKRPGTSGSGPTAS